MAHLHTSALWQYDISITMEDGQYTAYTDSIAAQGRTPAHAMSALVFALGLFEDEGATVEATRRIRVLETENAALRKQIQVLELAQDVMENKLVRIQGIMEE